MERRIAPNDSPIYRDAGAGADADVADGVLSVNAELVVSACNSRAADLFGAEGEEVVGASLWELFPDAIDTVAQTSVEEALADGQQRAFEWYGPETQTWFEIGVYPIDGGLTLFVRGLDDVGDHGRFPLSETGDEPSGVGGWRIDLPSKTLSVSEEVLRIRGLPPEYDLTLEEGIEFYHPQDRPTIRAAVERLRTEGETYDLELREIRSDGELAWVRTTGVAEYDEEGEVVALRGVYRDVTERKQRELEV